MEENWQDWEFMIDGDPHLLRGLTEQRGTQYFSLGGGVDHYNDCKNDDFRMNTLYAQDETDPYVVWQVGQELVNLLNGAFAPQFPQARLDEELEHARKLYMEFTLLHLATENQDVYFILKYLSMGPGWDYIEKAYGLKSAK
eukprot:gene29-34_t